MVRETDIFLFRAVLRARSLFQWGGGGRRRRGGATWTGEQNNSKLHYIRTDKTSQNIFKNLFWFDMVTDLTWKSILHTHDICNTKEWNMMKCDMKEWDKQSSRLSPLGGTKASPPLSGRPQVFKIISLSYHHHTNVILSYWHQIFKLLNTDVDHPPPPRRRHEGTESWFCPR